MILGGLLHENFQVVGQNEVLNEFIMATKICMKTVPDDDNDDIIFTTLILTSLTSWTQLGDQKTIPYGSNKYCIRTFVLYSKQGESKSTCTRGQSFGR